MGPLSLLESMDSADSGGLNPDSTWKSCQLRWPQYIYTCLTPKPNTNTNLNPNPNPNSNLRQWFGCWSPAESSGFHRTPASKVVQKEVLGNFDIESTRVHWSMWGSVKYCNSPATFQTMMNDIFRELVTEGTVVVYIDDILIFTETLEQHREVTC